MSFFRKLIDKIDKVADFPKSPTNITSTSTSSQNQVAKSSNLSTSSTAQPHHPPSSTTVSLFDHCSTPLGQSTTVPSPQSTDDVKKQITTFFSNILHSIKISPQKLPSQDILKSQWWIPMTNVFYQQSLLQAIDNQNYFLIKQLLPFVTLNAHMWNFHYSLSNLTQPTMISLIHIPLHRAVMSRNSRVVRLLLEATPTSLYSTLYSPSLSQSHQITLPSIRLNNASTASTFLGDGVNFTLCDPLVATSLNNTNNMLRLSSLSRALIDSMQYLLSQEYRAQAVLIPQLEHPSPPNKDQFHSPLTVYIPSTPLNHHASHRNRLEIINLLLQYGASINLHEINNKQQLLLHSLSNTILYPWLTAIYLRDPILLDALYFNPFAQQVDLNNIFFPITMLGLAASFISLPYIQYLLTRFGPPISSPLLSSTSSPSHHSSSLSLPSNQHSTSHLHPTQPISIPSSLPTTLNQPHTTNPLNSHLSKNFINLSALNCHGYSTLHELLIGYFSPDILHKIAISKTITSVLPVLEKKRQIIDLLVQKGAGFFNLNMLKLGTPPITLEMTNAHQLTQQLQTGLLDQNDIIPSLRSPSLPFQSQSHHSYFFSPIQINAIPYHIGLFYWWQPLNNLPLTQYPSVFLRHIQLTPHPNPLFPQSLSQLILPHDIIRTLPLIGQLMYTAITSQLTLFYKMLWDRSVLYHQWESTALQIIYTDKCDLLALYQQRKQLIYKYKLFKKPHLISSPSAPLSTFSSSNTQLSNTFSNPATTLHSDQNDTKEKGDKKDKKETKRSFFSFGKNKKDTKQNIIPPSTQVSACNPFDEAIGAKSPTSPTHNITPRIEKQPIQPTQPIQPIQSDSIVPKSSPKQTNKFDDSFLDHMDLSIEQNESTFSRDLNDIEQSILALQIKHQQLCWSSIYYSTQYHAKVLYFISPILNTSHHVYNQFNSSHQLSSQSFSTSSTSSMSITPIRTNVPSLQQFHASTATVSNAATTSNTPKNNSYITPTSFTPTAISNSSHTYTHNIRKMKPATQYANLLSAFPHSIHLFPQNYAQTAYEYSTTDIKVTIEENQSSNDKKSIFDIINNTPHQTPLDSPTNSPNLIDPEYTHLMKPMYCLSYPAISLIYALCLQGNVRCLLIFLNFIYSSPYPLHPYAHILSDYPVLQPFRGLLLSLTNVPLRPNQTASTPYNQSVASQIHSSSASTSSTSIFLSQLSPDQRLDWNTINLSDVHDIFTDPRIFQTLTDNLIAELQQREALTSGTLLQQITEIERRNKQVFIKTHGEKNQQRGPNNKSGIHTHNNIVIRSPTSSTPAFDTIMRTKDQNGSIPTPSDASTLQSLHGSRIASSMFVDNNSSDDSDDIPLPDINTTRRKDQSNSQLYSPLSPTTASSPHHSSKSNQIPQMTKITRQTSDSSSSSYAGPQTHSNHPSSASSTSYNKYTTKSLSGGLEAQNYKNYGPVSILARNNDSNAIMRSHYTFSLKDIFKPSNYFQSNQQTDLYGLDKWQEEKQQEYEDSTFMGQTNVDMEDIDSSHSYPVHKASPAYNHTSSGYNNTQKGGLYKKSHQEKLAAGRDQGHMKSKSNNPFDTSSSDTDDDIPSPFDLDLAYGSTTDVNMDENGQFSSKNPNVYVNSQGYSFEAQTKQNTAFVRKQKNENALKQIDVQLQGIAARTGGTGVWNPDQNENGRKQNFLDSSDKKEKKTIHAQRLVNDPFHGLGHGYTDTGNVHRELRGLYDKTKVTSLAHKTTGTLNRSLHESNDKLLLIQKDRENQEKYLQKVHEEIENDQTELTKPIKCFEEHQTDLKTDTVNMSLFYVQKQHILQSHDTDLWKYAYFIGLNEDMITKQTTKLRFLAHKLSHISSSDQIISSIIAMIQKYKLTDIERNELIHNIERNSSYEMPLTREKLLSLVEFAFDAKKLTLSSYLKPYDDDTSCFDGFFSHIFTMFLQDTTNHDDIDLEIAKSLPDTLNVLNGDTHNSSYSSLSNSTNILAPQTYSNASIKSIILKTHGFSPKRDLASITDPTTLTCGFEWMLFPSRISLQEFKHNLAFHSSYPSSRIETSLAPSTRPTSPTSLTFPTTSASLTILLNFSHLCNNFVHNIFMLGSLDFYYESLQIYLMQHFKFIQNNKILYHLTNDTHPLSVFQNLYSFEHLSIIYAKVLETCQNVKYEWIKDLRHIFDQYYTLNQLPCLSQPIPNHTINTTQNPIQSTTQASSSSKSFFGSLFKRKNQDLIETPTISSTTTTTTQSTSLTPITTSPIDPSLNIISNFQELYLSLFNQKGAMIFPDFFATCDTHCFRPLLLINSTSYRSLSDLQNFLSKNVSVHAPLYALPRQSVQLEQTLASMSTPINTSSLSTPANSSHFPFERDLLSQVIKYFKKCPKNIDDEIIPPFPALPSPPFIGFSQISTDSGGIDHIYGCNDMNQIHVDNKNTKNNQSIRPILSPLLNSQLSTSSLSANIPFNDTTISHGALSRGEKSEKNTCSCSLCFETLIPSVGPLYTPSITSIVPQKEILLLYIYPFVSIHQVGYLVPLELTSVIASESNLSDIHSTPDSFKKSRKSSSNSIPRFGQIAYLLTQPGGILNLNSNNSNNNRPSSTQTNLENLTHKSSLLDSRSSIVIEKITKKFLPHDLTSSQAFHKIPIYSSSFYRGTELSMLSQQSRIGNDDGFILPYINTAVTSQLFRSNFSSPSTSLPYTLKSALFGVLSKEVFLSDRFGTPSFQPAPLSQFGNPFLPSHLTQNTYRPYSTLFDHHQSNYLKKDPNEQYQTQYGSEVTQYCQNFPKMQVPYKPILLQDHSSYLLPASQGSTRSGFEGEPSLKLFLHHMKPYKHKHSLKMNNLFSETFAGVRSVLFFNHLKWKYYHVPTLRPFTTTRPLFQNISPLSPFQVFTAKHGRDSSKLHLFNASSLSPSLSQMTNAYVGAKISSRASPLDPTLVNSQQQSPNQSHQSYQATDSSSSFSSCISTYSYHSLMLLYTNPSGESYDFQNKLHNITRPGSSPNLLSLPLTSTFPSNHEIKPIANNPFTHISTLSDVHLQFSQLDDVNPSSLSSSEISSAVEQIIETLIVLGVKNNSKMLEMLIKHICMSSSTPIIHQLFQIYDNEQQDRQLPKNNKKKSKQSSIAQITRVTRASHSVTPQIELLNQHGIYLSQPLLFEEYDFQKTISPRLVETKIIPEYHRGYFHPTHQYSHHIVQNTICTQPLDNTSINAQSMGLPLKEPVELRFPLYSSLIFNQPNPDWLHFTHWLFENNFLRLITSSFIHHLSVESMGKFYTTFNQLQNYLLFLRTQSLKYQIQHDWIQNEYTCLPSHSKRYEDQFNKYLPTLIMRHNVSTSSGIQTASPLLEKQNSHKKINKNKFSPKSATSLIPNGTNPYQHQIDALFSFVFSFSRHAVDTIISTLTKMTPLSSPFYGIYTSNHYKHTEQLVQHQLLHQSMSSNQVATHNAISIAEFSHYLYTVVSYPYLKDYPHQQWLSGFIDAVDNDTNFKYGNKDHFWYLPRTTTTTVSPTTPANSQSHIISQTASNASSLSTSSMPMPTLNPILAKQSSLSSASQAQTTNKLQTIPSPRAIISTGLPSSNPFDEFSDETNSEHDIHRRSDANKCQSNHSYNNTDSSDSSSLEDVDDALNSIFNKSPAHITAQPTSTRSMATPHSNGTTESARTSWNFFSSSTKNGENSTKKQEPLPPSYSEVQALDDAVNNQINLQLMKRTMNKRGQKSYNFASDKYQPEQQQQQRQLTISPSNSQTDRYQSTNPTRKTAAQQAMIDLKKRSGNLRHLDSSSGTMVKQMEKVHKPIKPTKQPTEGHNVMQNMIDQTKRSELLGQSISPSSLLTSLSRLPSHQSVQSQSGSEIQSTHHGMSVTIVPSAISSTSQADSLPSQRTLPQTNHLTTLNSVTTIPFSPFKEVLPNEPLSYRLSKLPQNSTLFQSYSQMHSFYNKTAINFPSMPYFYQTFYQVSDRTIAINTPIKSHILTNPWRVFRTEKSSDCVSPKFNPTTTSIASTATNTTKTPNLSTPPSNNQNSYINFFTNTSNLESEVTPINHKFSIFFNAPATQHFELIDFNSNLEYIHHMSTLHLNSGIFIEPNIHSSQNDKNGQVATKLTIPSLQNMQYLDKIHKQFFSKPISPSLHGKQQINSLVRFHEYAQHIDDNLITMNIYYQSTSLLNKSYFNRLAFPSSCPNTDNNITLKSSSNINTNNNPTSIPSHLPLYDVNKSNQNAHNQQDTLTSHYDEQYIKSLDVHYHYLQSTSYQYKPLIPQPMLYFKLFTSLHDGKIGNPSHSISTNYTPADNYQNNSKTTQLPISIPMPYSSPPNTLNSSTYINFPPIYTPMHPHSIPTSPQWLFYNNIDEEQLTQHFCQTNQSRGLSARSKTDQFNTPYFTDDLFSSPYLASRDKITNRYLDLLRQSFKHNFLTQYSRNQHLLSCVLGERDITVLDDPVLRHHYQTYMIHMDHENNNDTSSKLASNHLDGQTGQQDVKRQYKVNLKMTQHKAPAMMSHEALLYNTHSLRKEVISIYQQLFSLQYMLHNGKKATSHVSSDVIKQHLISKLSSRQLHNPIDWPLYHTNQHRIIHNKQAHAQKKRAQYMLWLTQLQSIYLHSKVNRNASFSFAQLIGVVLLCQSTSNFPIELLSSPYTPPNSHSCDGSDLNDYLGRLSQKLHSVTIDDNNIQVNEVNDCKVILNSASNKFDPLPLQETKTSQAHKGYFGKLVHCGHLEKEAHFMQDSLHYYIAQQLRFVSLFKHYSTLLLSNTTSQSRCQNSPFSQDSHKIFIQTPSTSFELEEEQIITALSSGPIHDSTLQSIQEEKQENLSSQTQAQTDSLAVAQKYDFFHFPIKADTVQYLFHQYFQHCVALTHERQSESHNVLSSEKVQNSHQLLNDFNHAFISNQIDDIQSIYSWCNQSPHPNESHDTRNLHPYSLIQTPFPLLFSTPFVYSSHQISLYNHNYNPYLSDPQSIGSGPHTNSENSNKTLDLESVHNNNATRQSVHVGSPLAMNYFYTLYPSPNWIQLTSSNRQHVKERLMDFSINHYSQEELQMYNLGRFTPGLSGTMAFSSVSDHSLVADIYPSIFKDRFDQHVTQPTSSSTPVSSTTSSSLHTASTNPHASLLLRSHLSTDPKPQCQPKFQEYKVIQFESFQQTTQALSYSKNISNSPTHQYLATLFQLLDTMTIPALLQNFDSILGLLMQLKTSIISENGSEVPISTIIFNYVLSKLIVTSFSEAGTVNQFRNAHDASVYHQKITLPDIITPKILSSTLSSSISSFHMYTSLHPHIWSQSQYIRPLYTQKDVKTTKQQSQHSLFISWLLLPNASSALELGITLNNILDNVYVFITCLELQQYLLPSKYTLTEFHSQTILHHINLIEILLGNIAFLDQELYTDVIQSKNSINYDDYHTICDEFIQQSHQAQSYSSHLASINYLQCPITTTILINILSMRHGTILTSQQQLKYFQLILILLTHFGADLFHYHHTTLEQSNDHNTSNDNSDQQRSLSKQQSLEVSQNPHPHTPHSIDNSTRPPSLEIISSKPKEFVTTTYIPINLSTSNRTSSTYPILGPHFIPRIQNYLVPQSSPIPSSPLSDVTATNVNTSQASHTISSTKSPDSQKNQQFNQHTLQPSSDNQTNEFLPFAEPPSLFSLYPTHLIQPSTAALSQSLYHQMPFSSLRFTPMMLIILTQQFDLLHFLSIQLPSLLVSSIYRNQGYISFAKPISQHHLIQSTFQSNCQYCLLQYDSLLRINEEALKDRALSRPLIFSLPEPSPKFSSFDPLLTTPRHNLTSSSLLPQNLSINLLTNTSSMLGLNLALAPENSTPSIEVDRHRADNNYDSHDYDDDNDVWSDSDFIYSPHLGYSDDLYDTKNNQHKITDFHFCPSSLITTQFNPISNEYYSPSLDSVPDSDHMLIQAQFANSRNQIHLSYHHPSSDTSITASTFSSKLYTAHLNHTTHSVCPIHSPLAMLSNDLPNSDLFDHSDDIFDFFHKFSPKSIAGQDSKYLTDFTPSSSSFSSFSSSCPPTKPTSIFQLASYGSNNAATTCFPIDNMIKVPSTTVFNTYSRETILTSYLDVLGTIDLIIFSLIKPFMIVSTPPRSTFQLKLPSQGQQSQALFQQNLYYNIDYSSFLTLFPHMLAHSSYQGLPEKLHAHFLTLLAALPHLTPRLSPVTSPLISNHTLPHSHKLQLPDNAEQAHSKLFGRFTIISNTLSSASNICQNTIHNRKNLDAIQAQMYYFHPNLASIYLIQKYLKIAQTKRSQNMPIKLNSSLTMRSSADKKTDSNALGEFDDAGSDINLNAFMSTSLYDSPFDNDHDDTSDNKFSATLSKNGLNTNNASSATNNNSIATNPSLSNLSKEEQNVLNKLLVANSTNFSSSTYSNTHQLTATQTAASVLAESDQINSELNQFFAQNVNYQEELDPTIVNQLYQTSVASLQQKQHQQLQPLQTNTGPPIRKVSSALNQNSTSKPIQSSKDLALDSFLKASETDNSFFNDGVNSNTISPPHFPLLNPYLSDMLHHSLSTTLQQLFPRFQTDLESAINIAEDQLFSFVGGNINTRSKLSSSSSPNPSFDASTTFQFNTTLLIPLLEFRAQFIHSIIPIIRLHFPQYECDYV